MAKPDLISIVVKDMAAALVFYRLLDLDIPLDADAEAHVETTTPGGFRLAWDTADLMSTIHGEWPEPSGHRMVLAFECENPAGVDSLYDQLTSAGYHGHKPPWDAFWGQRYAVVYDPDGNLVDLFADLT
jgi:catechol 2,3-dioxygenase-like lactoylglutathione lyase family enzyme